MEETQQKNKKQKKNSLNIYLLNMQVRIKQYSDIEARYGSHEQRDLIDFTNPISQLKQLTIKDFAN